MHIRRTLWAGLGVAASVLLSTRPATNGVAAQHQVPLFPTASRFGASRLAGIGLSGALQPRIVLVSTAADENPSEAVPIQGADVKADPPQASAVEATRESSEQSLKLSVVQAPNASPNGAADQQRMCVVRRGDSLSRIAKRYHVSLSALAKANGIGARGKIRAGMRLRIPSAAGKATGTAKNAEITIAALPSEARLGNTALQYRGVPYRYAGMSSRGMDCSGLVARVLLTHGIRAPHNSRALFGLGHPVAKTDLQPDDLVFFNTRGRGISHVGIYLGEGKFVHASSGGGQVKVNTLDSGYYARRFAGARRLP